MEYVERFSSFEKLKVEYTISRDSLGDSRYKQLYKAKNFYLYLNLEK